MKDKKQNNNFKNPLSGIPVKSLLITLVMSLLFVFTGLFIGLCMAKCSNVKTAHAAETTLLLDTQGTTIELTYSNVSPSWQILQNTSSGYINAPVGYDFKGGNFSTDNQMLAQFFVNSSVPLYIQYPTYVNDEGKVPIDSYNRTLQFIYFTPGSSLDISGQFIIPFHDNGVFSPSWGVQAFNKASNPNYHYGRSIRIMQTGSFQTQASVADAVQQYGQPSYCLPLNVNFTSRVQPISIPVVGGGSATFTGHSLSLILRFYFGAFTDILPDTYCDIEVLAYSNLFASSTVSTFQLFGVDYEVLKRPLTSGQVTESYNRGFAAGRFEGFKAGLLQGRSEQLEDITPWQHIVNGVNSFVNLEILPGVKISIIISIGFGLILVSFLIRYYLGG